MAKPKPPSTVTLTELGQRYGYTFNAVKSWRAEGLPFDDDKKVCDEAAATKWIVENKINPMRNMSVKDEMDREKLREQKAKSDLAEIQVHQKSGELVEVDYVQAAFNQYATRIKDIIRLIPTVSANEIMEAATDVASTKSKLQEIIDKALNEIGDLIISESVLDEITGPLTEQEPNESEPEPDTDPDDPDSNGFELSY